MSKLRCRGCGQTASSKKVLYPGTKTKRKQCERCLTFEGDLAPVARDRGGPINHSLTYVLGKGGLGPVDKRFQNELPALQRAGWEVVTVTPVGQVRDLLSRTSPRSLIVTLKRTSSGQYSPQ